MGWRIAAAAAGVLVLPAAVARRVRGSRAAAGLRPSAGSATSSTRLGRKVYNFRCYFCHGYSGDAKTLAATYLQPQPRDFTGGRAGSWARDPDRAALRDGRPGTAMKSFAAS
jgi:cytochrome c oxidase cbb3-type subunit 3